MLESLAGQTVTRVSYEYGIRLLFSDSSWAYIETSFELHYDGQAYAIDPEKINENSARVLVVLHDDVVTSGVTDDGGLWLTFANGARIEVPPSWDYEAWSIGLSNPKSQIISTPGGSGITHFTD